MKKYHVDNISNLSNIFCDVIKKHKIKPYYVKCTKGDNYF